MSRAARIGVIGVSLGREVAIHAAARSPEWRATVLEGVPGASPADMQASEPDPATFVTIAAEYGLSRVLGGSGPPASNPDQIERIGPRPCSCSPPAEGPRPARARPASAAEAPRPSSGTSRTRHTPPRCGSIPRVTRSSGRQRRRRALRRSAQRAEHESDCDRRVAASTAHRRDPESSKKVAASSERRYGQPHGSCSPQGAPATRAPIHIEDRSRPRARLGGGCR